MVLWVVQNYGPVLRVPFPARVLEGKDLENFCTKVKELVDMGKGRLKGPFLLMTYWWHA